MVMVGGMVPVFSVELTVQFGWIGLRVGGQPALSLYSSNEPCELSQWLAMITSS